MGESSTIDPRETGPAVEPLLTLTEVADIYRVPSSTIRTWNKDGTIPAGFLVGRHWRWAPDAIRQDLARRSASATSQQGQAEATAVR